MFIYIQMIPISRFEKHEPKWEPNTAKLTEKYELQEKFFYLKYLIKIIGLPNFDLTIQITQNLT